MKYFLMVLLLILISGIHTSCYALRCTCDDWMGRGGYCVDYVNSRIPEFPIHLKKEEMSGLKNTDIADVTEGDVAIFAVGNYWHVAYVEKVHRNRQGEATALDVSEMNFGDKLSYAEFKAKWNSTSPAEWNRAICCGITDTYHQVTYRRNVDLITVKQLWSPGQAESAGVRGQRVKAMVGKVKETLNRIFQFTGREL